MYSDKFDISWVSTPYKIKRLQGLVDPWEYPCAKYIIRENGDCQNKGISKLPDYNIFERE